MASAGKYLSFGLGGEEFALPVLKVREIIKVMDITEIPQLPAHVRGVVNLRGQVVPVIDLRVRFDLEAADLTERSCIIVVDVAAGGERRAMGVIVDSVSEVMSLSGDEVDPPPALGDARSREYVVGLAKVEDSVKILLDLDRVLAADHLAVAA